MTVKVQWPDGTYSLPRTVQGCPTGWSTGWRYQDNEDNNNANYWQPSNLNSYMNFDLGTDYRTYYCTKTFSGSMSGSTWPRGRYCIARYGGSCPTGFAGGYIYWDDEDRNNANSLQGPIPDGDYGRNTRVQYCCRNDGNPSQGVRLPTTKAFVLYQFGPTCQVVMGMNYPVQLMVHFDDEDSNNENSCSGSHPNGSCGRNNEIYFCYYSPAN